MNEISSGRNFLRQAVTALEAVFDCYLAESDKKLSACDAHRGRFSLVLGQGGRIKNTSTALSREIIDDNWVSAQHRGIHQKGKIPHQKGKWAA